MKQTFSFTLNAVLSVVAVALVGVIALVLGYITKQSKDSPVFGTTLDPLLATNEAFADIITAGECGCCESSSSCAGGGGY